MLKEVIPGGVLASKMDIHPEKIVLAKGTPETWPVPGDDEVVIVPLGGIGEIGMNMTFYGHKGRWIGVDAGVGFPSDEEDRERGVRATIVDPLSLEPILDRLDAFFITHAHEDHIGAIPFLWPRYLNCPIYCTPFAAGLISIKLEEHADLEDVDIRRFAVGERLTHSVFDIEAIAMTHSIPEPVALAIRACDGVIVHTGDWKMEPHPILGTDMDIRRLTEIGMNERVLAIVGDSTNAERIEGMTTEASVKRAMRHIMNEATGAVVVCCFASNIPRIHAIAEEAFASGRKVAIAGRSMVNAEAVANECGLMNALPYFLADFMHLEGLDQREKALICTGSQGEPRAILGRIARGRRNLPAFGPGDTVVISAKAIPGNEPAINECIELLRSRGVRVITGEDFVGEEKWPVHVTGHATQDEIRTLYSILKPLAVVAVHGTQEGMVEHALVASELSSVSHAIVPVAGSVIRVGAAGTKDITVQGAVPFSVGEVMD